MVMRIREFAVVLGVGLAAIALHGSGRPDEQDLLLSRSAPEIVGGEGHWLGKSIPTALAQLRGKVIWLHFNF